MSYDVLRIPVTIFQNPLASVGEDSASNANPRPLKILGDFQKLLYRVDVSKDLMQSMILRGYELEREKVVREKKEQGVDVDALIKASAETAKVGTR